MYKSNILILINLIFISCVEFDIMSFRIKFTDDTEVLGKAACEEDCLKNDLDTLCSWSKSG